MSLLTRFLFGKSPPRIEHPVLGEALLMSTKNGSYWEVETEVAGQPFTVLIETVGDQKPTQTQVEFFQSFANDPGLAFKRSSSLLIPAYLKWTREPFPNNWMDAFLFAGMTVPLAADERNPWDLSFECLTG